MNIAKNMEAIFVAIIAIAAALLLQGWLDENTALFES